MSAIKYLLDENVHPGLRRAIEQQSSAIVVWRVGDPGVPPLETLDPEILIWCEENNCILITNNRASMPVHLEEHLEAGRHVPGIFILNPNMGMGETAEELALIHGASDPDEYTDKVTYLPVS